MSAPSKPSLKGYLMGLKHYSVSHEGFVYGWVNVRMYKRLTELGIFVKEVSSFGIQTRKDVALLETRVEALENFILKKWDISSTLHRVDVSIADVDCGSVDILVAKEYR